MLSYAFISYRQDFAVKIQATHWTVSVMLVLYGVQIIAHLWTEIFIKW